MAKKIVKQGKYTIKDSAKIVIKVRDLLGAGNLKLEIDNNNETGGDAIREFVKRISKRTKIKKGKIVIDELWKRMQQIDNYFFLAKDTEIKFKAKDLFKNEKIEVKANHFKQGVKIIARIIENKLKVNEGDITIENPQKNIIEIEKPIEHPSLFGTKI
ncbi:MAG: hypothetical protein ACOC1P_02650 [Minisyncoccales bacterium]